MFPISLIGNDHLLDVEANLTSKSSLRVSPADLKGSWKEGADDTKLGSKDNREWGKGIELGLKLLSYDGLGEVLRTSNLSLPLARDRVPRQAKTEAWCIPSGLFQGQEGKTSTAKSLPDV